MYNRLTMFTMDKSMLLEQVELRHEVRVAATGRRVDGNYLQTAPCSQEDRHRGAEKAMISSASEEQRRVKYVGKHTLIGAPDDASQSSPPTQCVRTLPKMP